MLTMVSTRILVISFLIISKGIYTTIRFKGIYHFDNGCFMKWQNIITKLFLRIYAVFTMHFFHCKEGIILKLSTLFKKTVAHRIPSICLASISPSYIASIFSAENALLISSFEIFISLTSTALSIIWTRASFSSFASPSIPKTIPNMSYYHC